MPLALGPARPTVPLVSGPQFKFDGRGGGATAGMRGEEAKLRRKAAIQAAAMGGEPPTPAAGAAGLRLLPRGGHGRIQPGALWRAHAGPLPCPLPRLLLHPFRFPVPFPLPHHLPRPVPRPLPHRLSFLVPSFIPSSFPFSFPLPFSLPSSPPSPPPISPPQPPGSCSLQVGSNPAQIRLKSGSNPAQIQRLKSSGSNPAAQSREGGSCSLQVGSNQASPHRRFPFLCSPPPPPLSSRRHRRSIRQTGGARACDSDGMAR